VLAFTPPKEQAALRCVVSRINPAGKAWQGKPFDLLLLLFYRTLRYVLRTTQGAVEKVGKSGVLRCFDACRAILRCE